MKDRFQPEHEGDLYTALDRDFVHSDYGKSLSVADIKKRSHSKTNFRNRGMGETGLTTREITDAEKMAMLVLRGEGLSNAEIAEQLKRSPASVAAVMTRVGKELEALGLNYDWRKIMEREVVDAVRAGLNDESDSYKRANIGIQAGKGIGMFEKDTSVNFAQIIGQIPESQRHRYISSEPANPNLISSETPKETANDSER